MTEGSPVTPEEIVGISYGNGGELRNGELRIPTEVIEKFQQKFGQKGDLDVLASPQKLFRAVRFKNGELNREYFHYEEGFLWPGPNQEDMTLGEYWDRSLDRNDYPPDKYQFTSIELAHRLKILAPDYFKVYHVDIENQGRNGLHTKLGLSFWPDGGGFDLLKFTYSFNDQLMGCTWDKNGELVFVFSKSLASDNGGDWGINFEKAQPIFWKSGSLDEHGLNRDNLLYLQGREAHVVFETEAIKMVFFRRKFPGVIDYSLRIPRRQKHINYLDSSGERQGRFEWEEDLISEPLRKQPFQQASDLDDVWKRADLTKLLGIEIEKNNPGPQL